MLILSESALKAAGRFIKGSDKPVLGLRIAVTGGGCSGMQYSMMLEEKTNFGDNVLEIEGLKILIDPFSAPLLKGVKLDFSDSLEGGGFKFENPNAAGGCGCGKSFSV